MCACACNDAPYLKKQVMMHAHVPYIKSKNEKNKSSTDRRYQYVDRCIPPPQRYEPSIFLSEVVEKQKNTYVRRSEQQETSLHEIAAGGGCEKRFAWLLLL